MSEEKIVESTRITSTTDSLGRKPQPVDFDYVARISGSSASQSLRIDVSSTDKFVSVLNSQFYTLQSDVARLRYFAQWQHKVIDYNSSYIALLLEQIDDEEFERVAVEYAEGQQHPEVANLAVEISRLQALTSLPLTVMDYSNMFGVNEDRIIEALRDSDLVVENSSYRLGSLE